MSDDEARHEDSDEVSGTLSNDDRDLREMDDEEDREELRTRYYGLLQELRVMLPGTQVLVAFLLTVPFNNRFTELDAVGRDLYGAALGTGALAIICFLAPTSFHRFGPRRSRVSRLRWSIRMVKIGLAFMATSLDVALVLVTRVVFGTAPALITGAVFTTLLIGLWVVLPQVAIPATTHNGD